MVLTLIVESDVLLPVCWRLEGTEGSALTRFAHNVIGELDTEHVLVTHELKGGLLRKGSGIVQVFPHQVALDSMRGLGSLIHGKAFT